MPNSLLWMFQMRVRYFAQILDVDEAFPDLFDGVGHIKDVQYSIKVDPNAVPKAMSFRRLPPNMLDKVKRISSNQLRLLNGFLR